MNKFNKSIQQVIQFALTFFMAMFALISGLQLVYLVKNGVTTQGLIMVVFFAAAAFAFNRVKENQKKQVAALSAAQNAATERQKSAPVYKHPASVQQFIASSKACPRCRDKLAVCLEPQHGSTFPHLATGAEPGDCKYYCPTCKKFLSMDEEYEDFTWEAPEVPEGVARPLPLLPGVPQAPGAAENHQHHRHDCRCPRYLPLFIFTQSLRFQPGTGWCDSVCRCLQRVSHHLLQGAPCPAGIPKGLL